MTDEIDTDAIRRMQPEREGAYWLGPLCDALDAARAMHDASCASAREFWQRAEKAEAERDRLMKLISVRETDWDATKAAIARVRAACEAYGSCINGYDPGESCGCLLCQVRIALGGETPSA